MAGTLSMFNFVTLNGFFCGIDGDISWHQHGADEGEVAEEGLKSQGTLLFGRKTYELMASFWPTPMGQENNPVVAEGMNKAPKVVFSRTLKNPTWNNTRVVSENITAEVRKLKQAGTDMTILGSGSIVTQLAEENLIDVYQLMINPVILGAGRSLFEGIKKPPQLKLIENKTFKSGIILLTYHPR